MNNTCTACSTTNRSVACYCKKCGTRLSSIKPEGLDDLIGMEDVKKVMKELASVMAAIKTDGLSYSDRLHTVLMGNTGTGKTKLVNILASLYHKYGVTKHDTPIIYDAVDYADFSKNFQDNFKKAKGNILCIENVQKLIPAGYSQSVEQLDRIFREMSKQENRLDPIIILSGQPQGLREFLNSNDGVKSMFRFVFSIPDFDSIQLAQLTEGELSKHGFKIPDDAKERLAKVFKFILIQSRMPDYEPEAINAWLALKGAENIKSNYYLRVTGSGSSERIISIDDVKGDIEELKTVEEVLAELDEFIGMQNVKEKVRSIVNSLRVKKAAAEKTGTNKLLLDFHILITGNPGTGKTSLARKLGEVVYAMGLLPRSTVHEIAPADVKGQYLGDAESLMNRALDQAMGGILFVDEAYGLAADQYGKKAAEVLMKRMTDAEGKILIIAAGYKDEMEGDFLRLNPGFPRRFEEDMRIHIDDYTPEELTKIFKLKADKDGYALAEGTAEVVKKAFEQMYAGRTKTFGNAGEAVNLLKATIRRVGNRIAGEGVEASPVIQPGDVAYELSKTLASRVRAFSHS